MRKISAKTSGYAILELLFYISFFAALSLVVISAMVTMTGSFKETALHAELVQSAGIMERMVREIRDAKSIGVIGASNLKLNTEDSTGGDTTVEFLLAGTDVELREDDVLTGDLNAPDIAVSALAFTQITTLQGSAVKIAITLSSKSDKTGRTFDFFNTVVLRGNY